MNELAETETEKTYSLALAEQPRIVGLSTGGEPITLEGHRVANHTESLPGIPTATYKRNVAYRTAVRQQRRDQLRRDCDLRERSQHLDAGLGL